MIPALPINLSQDLSALSSVATAVGALFAGYQLLLVKNLSRTQFEDQMAAQYRAIARELPIGALMGAPLSQSERDAALPIFYHYFDLCNEQAYLNKKHRVRRATWREWEDGIRQNLARPAFREAWRDIAAQIGIDTFDELRSTIAGFSPSQSINRTLLSTDND